VKAPVLSKKSSRNRPSTPGPLGYLSLAPRTLTICRISPGEPTALERPTALAKSRECGILPLPPGEAAGRDSARRVSNRVECQAAMAAESSIQGLPSRIMALRRTSSFLMQATIATFFGLPAATNRA